ncbi:MAG: TolC family protein [Myxococcales bacterium]|nr:TolC family protein [Myxococcales bacterium]
MKALLLWCLSALALLGGLAWAGEPLTQARAIQLTLARSPELTAELAAAAAQGELADSVAGAIENPEIRLEDLTTKYFDPEQERDFQLGFRWSPPRIGEPALRRQEETVDWFEKKLKADATRRKLIAEAGQLFAETAMLRESADLAARTADLEEQRLSRVEQFVQLGEADLLERLKTQRRLTKNRGEARSLQSRLAACETRLRALTGLSGELTLAADPPPNVEFDPAKLRLIATRNRAEMSWRQQWERLAQRRYDAARYRLIPQFSFIEVDHHFEGDDDDFDELRVGVEIPLFNWTVADRRATAILRRTAADRENATAEGIGREIDSSLANYREALAVWRATRGDAEKTRDLCAQQLEIARRQGLLSSVELLDLEIEGIAARRALAEALYELRAAAVELQAATGAAGWEELIAL